MMPTPLREAVARTSDYLATVIPLRTRRKIALARVSARSVTSQWRLLPQALIIGAQRGGTSSLHKYLSRHPEVAAPLRKEVGYFSIDYQNGEGWYRSHFPLRVRSQLVQRAIGRAFLCYDATPDYLLDPRAAERAARLLPGAKIVALLRNPVDRAFSQYQHNRRIGHEPLSFEAALVEESQRLAGERERLLEAPEAPLGKNYRRFSYVTRGMYAEQLARWLSHYPREQVLVVRSEDFIESTADVFRQIVAFLGLSPWEPAEFRNYSYFGRTAVPRSKISPEAQQLLVRIFAPHNQRLYELLGRDLNWEAAATPQLRVPSNPIEIGG